MSGQALKSQGIELVTQNNRQFIHNMRKAAITRAKKAGTVDSDYLRRLAKKRGIAPKSENAWGAIFSTPALIPVDVKNSITPSCRHRLIRVWAVA